MKATSLNLSFCPCLLNLVLFLSIFITLALSFNMKFDAVTPGVFQFYMELIRVLDKNGYRGILERTSRSESLGLERTVNYETLKFSRSTELQQLLWWADSTRHGTTPHAWLSRPAPPAMLPPGFGAAECPTRSLCLIPASPATSALRDGVPVGLKLGTVDLVIWEVPKYAPPGRLGVAEFCCYCY